jgi:bifunctional DNA-binding transcriptional regulator/antitoxin component of YhaV-PrlF toxin-antitoxin module
MMSKTTETDDRGRIVIPHEIRKKYGDRYRLVELDDRVEMIPIDDDPVAGLRNAIGDAFDDKSVAEIKREARNAARADALQDATDAEQQ